MRFLRFDWYGSVIAPPFAGADGISRVGPSIGIALRTAFFALIGLTMTQLGTAAALLTVSHAVKGELWSLMLIAPAVAGLGLAVIALQQAAIGLASRRPPTSGH